VPPVPLVPPRWRRVGAATLVPRWCRHPGAPPPANGASYTAHFVEN